MSTCFAQDKQEFGTNKIFVLVDGCLLKRVGNTKSSGGQPEIYSNTNKNNLSRAVFFVVDDVVRT